jgi:tRNA G18 (ribose-2'-O)-methylase SpoU
MALVPITDPDDPRISAYRDIRERDLTGRQGLFIAEGEVVLRVLASSASLCRPVSLLLAENRISGLADLIDDLAPEVPVHVASQSVIDAIAGFPLHRGVLALGEKPSGTTVEEQLSGLGREAVVLAASAIGNHDNMGGLFRNAAAFGADAVLLDDRCCDPFYRKAIRVSVGAALRTPFARAESLDAMLDGLESQGFEVLALTPSAREPLSAVRRGGRQALLLGSEGPGLPASVLSRCRTVGIEMAGGFDSLNVAATGAVALYQLTRAAPV